MTVTILKYDPVHSYDPDWKDLPTPSRPKKAKKEPGNHNTYVRCRECPSPDDPCHDCWKKSRANQARLDKRAEKKREKEFEQEQLKLKNNYLKEKPSSVIPNVTRMQAKEINKPDIVWDDTIGHPQWVGLVS